MVSYDLFIQTAPDWEELIKLQMARPKDQFPDSFNMAYAIFLRLAGLKVLRKEILRQGFEH